MCFILHPFAEDRMAEQSRPSPEELARQARQHLASLKAAGVEWLPAAPVRVEEPAPAVPARPATEPAPVESAPAPVSLFADLAAPAPGPATAAQTTALTPEQRRYELEMVAEKVASCRRCASLASTR